MAAPAAATTPTKAANDAEEAPPTPQDLAKRRPPAPPRTCPRARPRRARTACSSSGAPTARPASPVHALQDAFKRFRVPSAGHEARRVPAGRAGATGRGARAKDPPADASGSAGVHRAREHYIGALRLCATASPVIRCLRRQIDLLQFDPTVRPGPEGGLRLRPRGLEPGVRSARAPDATARQRRPAGRLAVRQGAGRDARRTSSAHDDRARRDRLAAEEFRDRAGVDARVAWTAGRASTVHDSFRYTRRSSTTSRTSSGGRCDRRCAGRCDAALLRGASADDRYERPRRRRRRRRSSPPTARLTTRAGRRLGARGGRGVPLLGRSGRAPRGTCTRPARIGVHGSLLDVLRDARLRRVELGGCVTFRTWARRTTLRVLRARRPRAPTLPGRLSPRGLRPA